jgi:two-component system response regulator AtoC
MATRSFTRSDRNANGAGTATSHARAEDPDGHANDKPMSPTVLIADDDATLRWTLRERMVMTGYKVVEADAAAAALEACRQGVDLVVLGDSLPGAATADVLALVREHSPEAPVILLTSDPSAEPPTVPEVYHSLHRPADPEELIAIVAKALETTRLRREVKRLREKDRAVTGVDLIVGESVATQQVKAMLRKVAESPASTVLITGESGTGKDVAAHAIHAQSDRRDAPFMNITCSALPEALLESELFGHERGAFTDAKASKKGLIAEADGGTVFLDEVAEMSPALQAKLLRFLEEKAFRRVGGTADIRPDVRVLAATHRDLEDAIRRGTFRADLYYRLAVLHVHLPPLRDRPEDIIPLATHFVESFDREFRRSVRGLTPAAQRLLLAYSWPGNVRELRNTIERAVLLADGAMLDVGDFGALAPARKATAEFVLPPDGISLREVERELVIQALERARGNQTRAAQLLGLTRDQVRYRIAKFRLGGGDGGAPSGEGPIAQDSDEGPIPTDD